MTDDLLVVKSEMERYIKSDRAGGESGLRMKKTSGPRGEAVASAVDRKVSQAIEELKERADFEARQTILPRDIPQEMVTDKKKSEADKILVKSRVKEAVKPFRISKEALGWLGAYAYNLLEAGKRLTENSDRKTVTGQDIIG